MIEKELIEEARRSCHYNEGHVLMRIVNALEAALRERDEALAVIEQVRTLKDGTPNLSDPETWWPLTMDSEEFRRGARWSDAWWRDHVTRPLDTAPVNALRAVQAKTLREVARAEFQPTFGVSYSGLDAQERIFRRADRIERKEA